MTYLYLYIFMLAVSAMTARARAARKVGYAFCLAILFVFVAFRNEQIGCDWTGYLNIFELQRNQTLENALLRQEPAFWLLNHALHYFEFEFAYINVVAAMVFFLGLHVFARRQPDPLAILILSFPVLLIGMPMTALRQAMAIGILCFAYNAFNDRNFVRYIAFVSLATTFHSSSMVFFTLVPLSQGALTRGKLALAAILALPGAAIMANTSAFEVYADRYNLGSRHDAIGGPFRAGLLALTGFLFLFFLNRRWKVSFPYDYKLAFLGACIMVANLPVVFLSSVTGDRIGYYLNPIQLMILARMSHFSRGAVSEFIGMLPYLASGLVLVVWTQLSYHFEFCYVPYRMWW